MDLSGVRLSIPSGRAAHTGRDSPGGRAARDTASLHFHASITSTNILDDCDYACDETNSDVTEIKLHFVNRVLLTGETVVFVVVFIRCQTRYKSSGLAY